MPREPKLHPRSSRHQRRATAPVPLPKLLRRKPSFAISLRTRLSPAGPQPRRPAPGPENQGLSYRHSIPGDTCRPPPLSHRHPVPLAPPAIPPPLLNAPLPTPLDPSPPKTLTTYFISPPHVSLSPPFPAEPQLHPRDPATRGRKRIRAAPQALSPRSRWSRTPPTLNSWSNGGAEAPASPIIPEGEGSLTSHLHPSPFFPLPPSPPPLPLAPSPPHTSVSKKKTQTPCHSPSSSEAVLCASLRTDFTRPPNPRRPGSGTENH
ncbi:hypothetical protein FKM82_012112 [Ascaphus truei]